MDYKKSDISSALENLHFKNGDIIFLHSNIAFFGTIEKYQSKHDILEAILGAIFDVIGTNGTLVVPTFTYSFGSTQKEKIFNVLSSQSKMGMFSEYIRTKTASVRSHDPMFSVSAIGKHAKYFTQDVADECFGNDSFWQRFHQANGKICNMNYGLVSTFIHYIEKSLKVDYRNDKKFSGLIIDEKGKISNRDILFFCQNTTAPYPNYNLLNDLAYHSDFASSIMVGRGKIESITAKDMFHVVKNLLIPNPCFIQSKNE